MTSPYWHKNMPRPEYLKFRQAILRLEPRAIERLQDIIRAHQGTYADFVARIGTIFLTAGVEPPEPSEIEHALIEADELRLNAVPSR